MKRTIFLLSVLASVAASASAEQISKDKAKSIAESFFQKGSVQTRAQSAEVKLVKEYASSDEAPAAIYAFTRAENLVFVSADDEMPSVLGYSDNADPNNLPPALEAMLSYYTALTDAVRSGSMRAPQLYASETTVDSLCVTLWDQDPPFSSLCPKKNGEQLPNGCASTAFAQVLRYHKWPVNPTAVIPAYKSERLNIDMPEDDLSERTYKWDDMLLDYKGSYTEVQGQAVAQLCYDLSMAAKMDFSYATTGGSGATYTVAAHNIREYFGYSKDAYIDYPIYYTEAEWADKLKNEINQGRPLPYSGLTGTGGGHCFVVDGYNAEGLFHINWGWGGKSNGYFLITTLNPHEQGIGGSNSHAGFALDQQTLFNFVPDDGTITASEHYIFQYHKTSLIEGDSIQFSAFWNRSLDDFHGDLVLKIVDKDGKVAAQQTVKTDYSLHWDKYEDVHLSLKDYDFSNVADGTYHTEVIAVSSATKTEYPVKRTEEDCRIFVENGKLKEIRNCAKLEGMSLGYKINKAEGSIFNFTVKVQVANIDDIDYTDGSGLKLFASITLPEHADKKITYSVSCSSSLIIYSGEAYIFEEELRLDYWFPIDYVKGILTIQLSCPNGIIFEEKHLLKDFANGITGITDVSAAQEVSDAPAYNLFGQPTQGQGFVVKGGRVVLVK